MSGFASVSFPRFDDYILKRLVGLAGRALITFKSLMAMMSAHVSFQEPYKEHLSTMGHFLTHLRQSNF